MITRSQMLVRLWGVVSVSLWMPLAAIGCHSTSSPPLKPLDSPDQVAVAGSTITSGFSRGDQRQSRSLSAFKITKYPVTWQQFDACVSSGKCEPADNSACSGIGAVAFPGYSSAPFNQKSAAAPAICVGEKQAEAYCRAVNGRLPTLDEWLLAARGPSPSRFSWGDKLPTRCDQHPFAAQLVSRLQPGDPAALEGCLAADVGSNATNEVRPNESDALTGGSAGANSNEADADASGSARPSSDDAYHVEGQVPDEGLTKKFVNVASAKDLSQDDIAIGKHANGASPSGIEDVLLAPGELLMGDEKGQFPACSRTDAHCVVFGTDPGAIDGVQAFYDLAKDNPTGARVVTGRAYGFRCVVSVKEESK